MIEQITSDNYREFSNRYLNTIGYLHSSSGKKIVVSIDAISSSNVVVSTHQGVQYVLNSDTGCELEFTQVPSQWYQVDDFHIAFLARKPERQWKRGINLENTAVWIPHTGGKTLGSYRPTIEMISSLLGEEKTGGFSRYAKIKCGLWSKYFAWSEETVWVKDIPIGKVDHESKIVDLTLKQFQQELTDALIRSNSDYSVKVQ